MDEFNLTNDEYKVTTSVEWYDEHVKTPYVLELEKRIEELEKELKFLGCLREAGVDNWEGYSYACELFYNK
jgi:hypothetical protein